MYTSQEQKLGENEKDKYGPSEGNLSKCLESASKKPISEFT